MARPRTPLTPLAATLLGRVPDHVVARLQTELEGQAISRHAVSSRRREAGIRGVSTRQLSPAQAAEARALALAYCDALAAPVPAWVDEMLASAARCTVEALRAAAAAPPSDEALPPAPGDLDTLAERLDASIATAADPAAEAEAALLLLASARYNQHKLASRLVAARRAGLTDRGAGLPETAATLKAAASRLLGDAATSTPVTPA